MSRGGENEGSKQRGRIFKIPSPQGERVVGGRGIGKNLNSWENIKKKEKGKVFLQNLMRRGGGGQDASEQWKKEFEHERKKKMRERHDSKSGWGCTFV